MNTIQVTLTKAAQNRHTAHLQTARALSTVTDWTMGAAHAQGQPVTETKSEACAMCRHINFPSASLVAVTNGPKICSFCAVYLLKDEPLPEPLAFVDANQFRGAWFDFADDAIQYRANAGSEYEQLRFRANDVLVDEALRAYIAGSVMNEGTQKAALLTLWPMLAYERIFARLDAAFGLAECYRCNWNFCEVERLLQRPDIAPVWLWWCAANVEHGRKLVRGETYWHLQALRHEEECGE